jgi:hypothetical protein
LVDAIKELDRMSEEAALLAKIEMMPANRGRPNPRQLVRSARDDLEQLADNLPPVYTEEERKDRQARFARFIARAVRRGAMPAGFAQVLLQKLMPNEQPPARLVSLPDLPRVVDASSYRQALEVIAAAVAGAQVTVDEARVLTSIIKATWAALRAERREAR